MIYLTIVLVFLLAVISFVSPKKINQPPGMPIPTALVLTWAFLHPHLGKVLSKIGEKYGPIVHLGLGRFKMVLLNGTDVIREGCRQPMLNGRADCMYKDVFGHEGIVFCDNTSQKRKFIFRNARHVGLGAESAENYIHEEISLLFKYFDSFEGKPVRVKHVFNIPALNGVLQRLLGEKVPHDHPNLKNLVSKLCVMSEIPNPIMKACVFAPQLTRWIPGWLSGRSFVKQAVKDSLELYGPYLEKHFESRIPSQPRDLVDALMDQVEATTDTQSDFHVSHNPIGPILFDMLAAAIETSGALLEWTILYLSHYPEVQAKLQTEVDKVIGTERLPEISDRPQMPYLQAFLQEMFRIAPVVPFGFHMAVEDTQFGGYTIEKGTTILSNWYGTHMNPKIWVKPEELRPERFLDEDGQFIKSDQLFIFGFGKRSCVGEVLARDQFFLYLSRILQSYTLVPEKKSMSFKGFFAMGYHCSSFNAIFNKRQ